MKQVIAFLILCLYVLGLVGGVGYSIYCGAWPIAIGVLALGVMAFPKAREYFDVLIIQ